MLYDVTRPLPRAQWLHDEQDSAVVAINLYQGTHLNAPLRVIPNGLSVDQLDLGLLLGPCYVAALEDATVTVAALEAANIPADSERLLLRTHTSAQWPREAAHVPTTFVALTPEAADWIVQRGVRLLGIDAPIVVSDTQQASAYILFGAEVAIVAGVALEALLSGMYTMYCFPLPLVGTDAAPCRILLSDEAGIRPS